MPKNPSRTTALIYLVLLVAIAVLAWSIFQSNRLNASAEAMALNVVQDTFSQDYPEQLLLNSHPNFQREFPEDQLVRYLNGINLRAGPLESLVSISGGSNVPLIGWSRGLKSASYEVELQFRIPEPTYR